MVKEEGLLQWAREVAHLDQEGKLKGEFCLRRLKCTVHQLQGLQVCFESNKIETPGNGERWS